MAFDCEEIRRALRGGSLPEGPEVELHLERCPGCAELLGDDATLGRELGRSSRALGGDLDVDALFGPLERAIGEEKGVRAYLRSRSSMLRLLLGLGALLAVGVFKLLKPRPDLGVYPLGRLLLEIVALVSVSGLALWAWLRPLHKPALPGAFSWAVVLGGVMLPTVLAVLPAAHVAHPASVAGVGPELVPRAAACLIFGAMLALPVLGLAFGLSRDTDPDWPRLLLAAAGGALGGAFGLHLHCAITHNAHLLLGHATLPVLVAVGVLLPRFWRARRRAPSASS